jgi:hypothetical protein
VTEPILRSDLAELGVRLSTYEAMGAQVEDGARQFSALLALDIASCAARQVAHSVVSCSRRRALPEARTVRWR